MTSLVNSMTISLVTIRCIYRFYVNVCGMVLVDYRKAFDMVDHKLLLRKLELYGIVNRELAP